MSEILGMHYAFDFYIAKEPVRVSETALHLTTDFNVLWNLPEDVVNTCAIVSSFFLKNITPFFEDIRISSLYMYIKTSEQYEALYFLQTNRNYIKDIYIVDPRLEAPISAGKWINYLTEVEKSRKSESIRTQAMYLLRSFENKKIKSISIDDFFEEYKRLYNHQKITKDWLLRALSKEEIRVNPIHIPALKKTTLSTTRLNQFEKSPPKRTKRIPK